MRSFEPQLVPIVRDRHIGTHKKYYVKPYMPMFLMWFKPKLSNNDFLNPQALAFNLYSLEYS
jgi:hypothetical protein